MLIFADSMALITSAIISVVCIVFYFAYSKNKSKKLVSVEEEIGVIEEPSENDKRKMDNEYKLWKYATIMVTIIALGIYIIPMIL